MPDKLWIHIDSNDQLTWMSAEELRPRTDIENIPRNLAATVFVPTQAVFITSVNLPGIKSSQIRQALPYALEDQIAEDIEDMHIVAVAKEADQITAFAVQNSKIQQWLGLCESKNISVQRLLPDVYALPYQNQATIGLFNTYSLIRNNFYQGYSLDNDNLIYLMNENQIELDNFKIINFADNLPIILKQKLPAAAIKNQAELLTFAAEQEYPAQLNLLQGDYRTKHSYKKTIRPFRTIIILLLLWLLIIFGGKAALLIYYHYQEQKVQQQLQTIYSQIFPGEVFDQNASNRLLQALTRIQGETKDPFLNLLANFGKVYQTRQADLPLQSMQFNKGTLDITLQPKNIDSLNNLVITLQKQSFKVVQKKNDDQTITLTIGK